MKLENTAQRMLDHVSLPILLIDRDFRVVAANNAVSTHFELPPEKVIGHPCYKLTHGRDAPCWLRTELSCPVRTAFRERARTRVIHNHQVANAVVVEEIVATPLDDGNHVVEEFRNITELLGLVDGFLPTCSSCHKVRDETGNWQHVENYIRNHTGADFTHTLCPKCMRTLYPENSGGENERPCQVRRS